MRRSRAFLAFVHLAGLFIIYRLGADAMADMACRSGNSLALKIASFTSPGDARVCYNLALKGQYSLKRPEPDRAIGLYRLAVLRDPLYARAWYQMALACRLSGRHRDAGAAISRYEELRGTYGQDLWDIGIFRLEDGEEDRAAADFKRCIELRPGAVAGVSGLFLLLNTPQGYMAEKVLPRTSVAYNGYIDYLLGSDMADSALSFLRFSHGLVGLDRKAALCRLLLAQGRIDEALDFWRHLPGGGDCGSGPAMANGGFERPLGKRADACFGWVAQDGPGFTLSYDGSRRTEGKRSLHVRFNGHRGQGFLLWQYIIVAPARSYELKADIRTKNVVTASGIRLEVWSQACRGYYARSPQLRGTGRWRELSVAFQAPRGCRLLKAGIARDGPLKLDRTDRSDLWIDNVRVSACGRFLPCAREKAGMKKAKKP